jgi:AraC-like DNA-binding protein
MCSVRAAVNGLSPSTPMGRMQSGCAGRLLPGAACSQSNRLETLAKKLNCSERRLRRYLSEEGVQYSERVHKVRFERAV